MANEGTRYNRKTTKKGKLITGAVPLKQHLEDLRIANNSYLKDTAKSEFNFISGEGSPGVQTAAGYEALKKSKTYYFRNPGRNRSEREAGAVHPPYIKEEKMDKGRDQVISGDIKISKRRQAFEQAIAPRIEKIEQEYAANKIARASGQIRINKK